MYRMHIVADENIPYVQEAFEMLGHVSTMPGRRLDGQALSNAEMLLVRSVTRVDATLLEGTPIRFVATATIGEDHIDHKYLDSKGIAFSSAPGSNANSTAEYVVAALLVLADKYGLALPRLRLGIVGVGNVGSKVLAMAQALGITCVLHDPPLAEKTGNTKYRPIDEILACDIITLHVNLKRDGSHPTWYFADRSFFDRLSPQTTFINTSRGPVVDSAALKAALSRGALRAVVLDVWEGEPEVDAELVALADIATPHIAGYSFDGKVNGTQKIYDAVCRFLGISPEWDPAPLMPRPEHPELRLEGACECVLSGAVKTIYDIMRDDAAMRGLLAESVSERGPYFERLRKNYPRRREFFNTCIRQTASNEALERQLTGIGFRYAAG